MLLLLSNSIVKKFNDGHINWDIKRSYKCSEQSPLTKEVLFPPSNIPLCCTQKEDHLKSLPNQGMSNGICQLLWG